MIRVGSIRGTLLICVLLSALSVAAFWPVMQAEFLNFDDPLYVTGNSHVLKGLTWENLGWAFKSLGESGFWHPLTWLSLMLDVELYGLQPEGFHATALLFHIANTLLVFLVLQRMTGAQWRSAMVAALFALHPLHVESVAWIAERKDVLSTFFFLLSLWAYARYARSPQSTVHGPQSVAHSPRSTVQSPQSDVRDQRSGAQRSNRERTHGTRNTEHPALRDSTHLSRRLVPPKSDEGGSQTKADHASRLFYGLALAFFILGLMSKTLVVTLPGVLLLLDWWPLRRIDLTWAELRQKAWPLVREKLPFCVLAVACVVVTIYGEKQIGAVSFSGGPPIQTRLMNAVVSYVRYLEKVVWPNDLAAFYPYPQQFHFWQVFGAGAVLAGVTVLAIGLRRRPYIAVGWFWYLGTLVPMIGLIQIGSHAMADRYTYVPLIGIFVAIVWAAADLAEGKPAARIGFAVGGTALVAACALATCKQTTYWRNTRSLFEHAVAVTHDNAVAQNDLGACLLNAGELSAAELHFAEAVRLQSNYCAALVNLSICRQKQGRLPEAIALQEKALQIQPIAMNHYNLACSFLSQSNLPQAELHLEAALKLEPAYFEAWYNLGVLEAKQHKNEEAAQAFGAALRLRPDFPNAHLKLGAVLVEEQRWDDAIAHLERGLQAMPGSAQARKELGVALVSRGHMAEAVPQLEAALQDSPDARTHYYLALALHGQGQFADALTQYREAVRLDPNMPDYANDLAWLLATCPQAEVRDGKEAVRLAEQACQVIGGKEARFWGTLDAAYAEAGRFDEAVATAQKARALALAAGQKDIAEAAEARLALYRAGKAYRQ